jgi:hypothetical protein
VEQIALSARMKKEAEVVHGFIHRAIEKSTRPLLKPDEVENTLFFRGRTNDHDMANTPISEETPLQDLGSVFSFPLFLVV